MEASGADSVRDQAIQSLKKKRDFKMHLLMFVAVNALLVVIWAVTNPDGFFWPIFPIHGWGIGVEWTDDPHPRNMYWEMWYQPRFGVERPEQVLDMVRACREAHPNSYVAVTAFQSTRHRQGIMLHIVVQRPSHEPELRIERQLQDGRRQGYTLTSIR